MGHGDHLWEKKEAHKSKTLFGLLVEHNMNETNASDCNKCSFFPPHQENKAKHSLLFHTHPKDETFKNNKERERKVDWAFPKHSRLPSATSSLCQYRKSQQPLHLRNMVRLLLALLNKAH